MYIDKLHELSAEQEVTVSAGSTNVIDLGENVGAGEELHLHVQVDTAFGAAGAATMSVGLRSDTDEGMATDVIVHWTGPAIAVADLVAGYTFNLPPLPAKHYRYIDLYYTVATGPMTAGALSAWLVHEKQTNKREAPVA